MKRTRYPPRGRGILLRMREVAPHWNTSETLVRCLVLCNHMPGLIPYGTTYRFQAGPFYEWIAAGQPPVKRKRRPQRDQRWLERTKKRKLR